MVKRPGKCLCGAIGFEVTGEPHVAGHCHCRDCQKISGGGHASFAFFTEADVAVSGRPKDFAVAVEPAGTMTRMFCPQCGSKLFARSTNIPGLLGIALGAFDEPGDLVPTVSLFVSRRLAWDPPAAGTAPFERGLRG